MCNDVGSQTAGLAPATTVPSVRGWDVADAQLETAIANWGPRFTANGVDASDVAELARSVDSWGGWCAAWSVIGDRHELLGRVALAEGRNRSAGEHLAAAATAFHFGRFLFVHDPGQERVAHDHAVRCLNDALAHLDPPGERHLVPFDGSNLYGVLRRPAGPPRPVVVLVPGLDSTKEELRLVERSFLDRGLATFAVDGPGQGEAEYALAIRPDFEVAGRAVLDHLERCEGVDASRVGVWGVSLGGYYAPRIAAGDERVRACIALAGPYSLGPAWDGLPSLTRDAFLVRSHASSPEEAREVAEAIDLAGLGPRIRCPLLVVFGARDRLFPPEGARRLAAEAAGPTRLVMVEDGNHGCANGVYRHRPMSADWMAEQLAR